MSDSGEEYIGDDALEIIEADPNEMMDDEDDHEQLQDHEDNSIFTIGVPPSSDEDEGSLFHVAFHPTLPVVLTGGSQDLSYIFPLDQTGSEAVKLTGHTDSVVCSAWDFTGDFVATGGMDGKVRVWRNRGLNAAWEFIANLEGTDEVTWVTFHPRGALLAAGGASSVIYLWTLPNGRIQQTLAGAHFAPLTVGKFTPDGKKMLTADEEGTAVLWDLKEGTVLHKWNKDDARFAFPVANSEEEEAGGITTLAISPNSTLALIGGFGGILRLVNLVNGQLLASLEGHDAESSIEALDWWTVPPASGLGNDMGFAVSGGTDGRVSIWEERGGGLRLRSHGTHEEAVTSLAHPTEKTRSNLFVTGSSTGNLQLWDVRSGHVLGVFKGFVDVVHAVSVKAKQEEEGVWVAGAGDEGTVKIWSYPHQEVLPPPPAEAPAVAEATPMET